MIFGNYTRMVVLDTTYIYQYTQPHAHLHALDFGVLRVFGRVVGRVRKNGGCVWWRVPTRGTTRPNTRSPPVAIF